MNVFKKTASFIVFICLTVNPTFAYDKKDEAIIINKIEEIQKGYRNNDMTPVVDAVPPKLLILVSKETGLSVEEAKHVLKKKQALILEGVDLGKLHYDVDVSKIKTFKSETNREYALVPTEFSLRLEDKIVKTTSTSFAVKDDDTWYFISLDSDVKSLFIVPEIYPSITSYKIIEMLGFINKKETKVIDK